MIVTIVLKKINSYAMTQSLNRTKPGELWHSFGECCETGGSERGDRNINKYLSYSNPVTKQ